MGEQRNLTEENVEELTAKLEKMQKEAQEKTMDIEKGTPIDEKAAAMVIETAKVKLPLMELDFKDREELYQNICQAAKEELRTPENQLMWWIMNADPEKMRVGMRLKGVGR